MSCIKQSPQFNMTGEDIALLAGDALLSFAFEHVVRDTVGVSAERLVKVEVVSTGAPE